MTSRFEAIGTHWTIVTDQTPPSFDDTIVAAHIRDRIEAFDQTYSRFRPDSLVTHMSKQAGTYRLPDDAAPLLKLYRELYGLTDGAVTPLIGNTLSDAGYDAAYSFVERPMQSPPRWESALSYTEPTLELRQPVLLDVGAAGKGYLVDIVASILETAGCHDYLIDAGGDIRVKGRELRRIGLENPWNSREAIGLAELSTGALCGSAGTRRTWGRFNHILDPHRLESPHELAAVWVRADNALLADGLTTTLMFTRPRTLTAHYRFDWLLLHTDGTTEKSPDFPATIFHG